MNSFHIKVFAVVCMVIDHVGLFFFPQFTFFRWIGRLAFPLFAWMIANGAVHSKNVRSYASRLLLLGLIAQVPFWYANQSIDMPIWFFNVVFTLCLGLLSIIVIRSVSNRFYWLLATLCSAALAVAFNTDYGVAGVLSVVAFYLFRNDFRMLAVSQTFLLGLLPLVVYQLQLHQIADVSRFYLASSIEWVGLLSLMIIYLHNQRSGPNVKYFFYYFYPCQYLVILAISAMLVYGKPHYPVVRAVTSETVSLVFIGRALPEAKACQEANSRVIESIRSRCPQCNITLQDCSRRLGETWMAAIQDRSPEFYVVDMQTSHVVIESDSVTSEAVCHSMVKQINEEGEQHAQCFSP